MEKIILRYFQTSQTMGEKQSCAAQYGEMLSSEMEGGISPATSTEWVGNNQLESSLALVDAQLNRNHQHALEAKRTNSTLGWVRTSITGDVIPPLYPTAAEITSGAQGPVLAPNNSQTWMHSSKSSKGSQDDEGFYHLIWMLPCKSWSLQVRNSESRITCINLNSFLELWTTKLLLCAVRSLFTHVNSCKNRLSFILWLRSITIHQQTDFIKHSSKTTCTYRRYSVSVYKVHIAQLTYSSNNFNSGS